uniref:Uncharacterized protein n=1 Tax=Arundo donax TaxID=35708 RepID=A0A0A9BX02_ARUDO
MMWPCSGYATTTACGLPTRPVGATPPASCTMA